MLEDIIKRYRKNIVAIDEIDKRCNEYITNIFYPWLVEQKTEFPVILYMDNHSSHLNLPLVTFCREKQIELTILPPNSTHNAAFGHFTFPSL